MSFIILPSGKNKYRLQHIHTGEFTNDKPMNKEKAKKQAVNIYVNEMHKKPTDASLYSKIKSRVTGGSHDILGNSVSHNVYKRAMVNQQLDPFT